MTSVVGKFANSANPASAAVRDNSFHPMSGTRSSGQQQHQQQPTRDSAQRCDPQARVISPSLSPIRNAGNCIDERAGSTTAAGVSMLDGLTLLSAAAENQSIEDIIDESLKDFDLSTITMNLQPRKTV